MTRAPDPALARALARWQHAAGPYWPYVGAAPFVGRVPARRSPGVGRADPALAAAIEGSLAREDTALFVDLPPTATLPLAPRLNHLGWFVVPAFERWAVSPAVLRCGQLLALLVATGERVALPRRGRGLVVLLDSERAGRPGIVPRASVFDNRYIYGARPFPSPALLLHHGIRRVQWLAPNGIAADLHGYAAQLAQAGLSPLLSSCAGLPGRSRA